jgi:hypothetical protein
MTTIKTHTNIVTMHRSVRAVAALTLSMSAFACSADKLNITNPNTPSIAGASGSPQALQLEATGITFDVRATRGNYILSTGIFGREIYNYTPQEPRNVSGFLIGVPGANRLDYSGFANGNWGAQYGTLRDIFNFKATIAAQAAFTPAQKSASLGFAQTMEALTLLELIATRDSLGIVVEVRADPLVVAPFVSRDSAYKYILNTLDNANTNLLAGGAAFPFTLHSGFAGFNTPATFAQLNRAIASKAASYYATAEGGAAAWTRSLAAGSASFLNVNATTRAAYDAGPFHPYGSSPDVNNPLNATTGVNLYAHPSIQTDAPLKADGTLDNRYLAKVGPKVTRTAPGGFGIASSLGYTQPATISSPIYIIRNEELMLIRAEGLLATGDKAGTLAIINNIRVNSGGLAASTLTTSSSANDILTELLLQKRYSTALEGDRWVDMRRYGRLSQLPLDIPSGPNMHFVAKVQPVPQAECLVRVGNAALAGPGCP